MFRRWIVVCGLLMLATSTGCAICSSEFDYDYNAFGGRYDRAERCRGRAGSAFEPAEARLAPVPDASEPSLAAPAPEVDDAG